MGARREQELFQGFDRLETCGADGEKRLILKRMARKGLRPWRSGSLGRIPDTRPGRLPWLESGQALPQPPGIA
jgi:hypothetical protein